MRKQKLRKAIYIKYGRGMSFKAIESYKNGMKPISKWANELGLRTDEIRALFDYESSHHTGKYAKRTPFYSAPEKGELIRRAKGVVSTKKKKFWDFVDKNQLN